MGRFNLVLALGAALSLVSCADTYRVDDGSGRSRVLKADQRIILTKPRGESAPTVAVVCAEPNPDVAVGRNVTVNVTGKAGAGQAAVPASGELQVGTAVTETLHELKRSNAIQVLRDIGYRVCEAYLNGAIGDEEYARVLHATGTVITAFLAIDALREFKDTPEAAKAIAKIVELVATLPGPMGLEAQNGGSRSARQ